MFRKVFLAVSAFIVCAGLSFAGSTLPAQAQVFAIPCPMIPCPTFDGANFSKNTLTEIHNLQIMKDTILAKYYQYKNLLANTQGLKNMSWQDITGQLDQIQALIHKDEEECAKMGYGNRYFSDKFPNSNASPDSPCNAANIEETKHILQNQKNALDQVAKNEKEQVRIRGGHMGELAHTTGTLQAIQAAGRITGDLANEMAGQIQEQQAAATMQYHYYEAELTKDAQNKAESKYSRQMSNYYKTGRCYNDPQDSKTKNTCVTKRPKDPSLR